MDETASRLGCGGGLAGETPGVVFALSLAVKAFTEPGDSVLIQQPVYYPFKRVVEVNGRRTISNTLVYENNKYFMDFEDFEEKIIREKIKLFILATLIIR